MFIDDEGSVHVDGSDVGDGVSELGPDPELHQEEDAGQVEEAGTQEDEPSEDKPEADTKAEEPKTDKGTKLAADPLQQANQLRANAEARLRQYEQFMNDPQSIKAYLAELEGEKGQPQEQPRETKQEDRISPDQIETTEDLKRFTRQLEADYQKKIAEVEQKLTGFTKSQEDKEMKTYWKTEARAVVERYPELKQYNDDGTPNPAFDLELTQAYDELLDEAAEIDKQSGLPKRKIDLRRFTDNFMRARKRGEQDGSRKAQTIVKDRREGRVIAGTTAPAAPDEGQMSSSQLIASRIQRAFARRTR